MLKHLPPSLKKNYRVPFAMLFLANILCSASIFAQRTIPDSLDSYIKKLMHDYKVPGLSIAIVSNYSVAYIKGFGTKAIGKNASVNENTIFAIGSISKSFTSLALGILESENKIKWDDKVIKYLP